MAFIPIAKHEALLDEVKAFARLSFMLLADVLWSVSEAGLFQEVVLGALEESWVAVVFIGIEKLHRLAILFNSKFVELVKSILLLFFALFLLVIILI